MTKKLRETTSIWASAKNADRIRPLLSVTLSRPCIDTLDRLADKLHYSRGVVVEAMILAEAERISADAERFLGVLEARCAEIAGRAPAAQKKAAKTAKK
jgi:hypothetical protein